MKKIFLTILILMISSVCFAGGPPAPPDSGAGAPVDTTNFNGTLSATENTIQKVVDKLDDVAPGAGAPTSAHYLTDQAEGGLSDEVVVSTIGKAVATSTNPGAIRFGRANADNTFTWLSDSDFRTAIGLAIGTNVQAYDADLTTYAGITPSANIQTLLGSADYATARTNLGLAIGTNVQAYDADLTTYAGITPSANVQTLLGSADYAAFRTNLSLVPGTNVQAFDADLSTWAGITPGSGVGAWIVTPSSTNFADAVTGETGSGALMFGTSPTITTSLLMTNGSDLRVATTTTGHEWSIPIYDVDHTTWRDAFNFANGDTPTVTAGAAVTYDFTSAGAVNLGPSVWADSDGSPSTVGQIRYDNTVTNIDDGGFQWYDDDEPKQFIDMPVTDLVNCTDTQVVSKNGATGKFYCKADADSGGSTALNAIGDAAADGTIAQTGYKQTWTSTLNSAGSIWTFTNTTADLTADVSFFDFIYTDNGDANGFFQRGYDNTNELKWSIGVDGAFTTGQLNPIASDGAALGTTSLMWSDLFLASGGVINFNNGDVTITHSSNVLAFGGASTAYTFDAPVRLLASDDPDTATAGDISLDTDGWLRVYNASRQNAVPLDEVIQVVVYKPNDMADAQRDAYGPIFTNSRGMSFIVDYWYATSTSDDTDLNIEEIDADGANNATVDAVSITTNGTGIFYASDSTITGATIENGHNIMLDFDDTDAPAQVTIHIKGHYNADVN